MYNLPQKPLTTYEIFYHTFYLWWHSLGTLIILSLLAIIVGTLPHFFVFDIASFHLKNLLIFIHHNYLFFILYFIFAVYFLSAILYRISMFISNEKGGIIFAFLIALKYLVYSCIAAFLAAIMISLASAFFLIPGIYILFLIIFYQPLILIDQLKPIQALKQSYKLVKDHWWRVFIILTMPTIVVHIVQVFIELSVADLLALNHSILKIKLYNGIFRAAVSSLYYPFVCSLLLVLLHDLKIRKMAIGEVAADVASV